MSSPEERGPIRSHGQPVHVMSVLISPLCHVPAAGWASPKKPSSSEKRSWTQQWRSSRSAPGGQRRTARAAGPLRSPLQTIVPEERLTT